MKGPWFETHGFCLGKKERNVRSESFSVCHAEELAKQTDKKWHTSSAYKQHMVLSISFVFSCTYYILYHFLRCFFFIYTQINSVISQPNVHVKNVLVGTSTAELHLKCFELVKGHISKAAAYYFKFKEFEVPSEMIYWNAYKWMRCLNHKIWQFHQYVSICIHCSLHTTVDLQRYNNFTCCAFIDPLIRILKFCIISISLIYDSNNLKSRNAF